MKTVWKGSISFGLVNIPVRLQKAEERPALVFKMIDSRDHARIRYLRMNIETGQEVPWEKIAKAYEFEDGSYVVVTEEDFEKADIKASRTIKIEQFVEESDLNPMYLERPYYITPVSGGEKAYVLLREAMKESGKVAIGRVTLRSRQSMGAIIPVDDALVLNLLRYAEELKGTESLELPEDARVSDQELEMAITLITNLTEEWDPEEFRDEYTQVLLNRIRAKARLQGKNLPEEKPEENGRETNMVDILELLQQSIDAQTKKGRKPTRPGRRTKKTADGTDISPDGVSKRKSS